MAVSQTSLNRKSRGWFFVGFKRTNVGCELGQARQTDVLGIHPSCSSRQRRGQRRLGSRPRWMGCSRPSPPGRPRSTLRALDRQTLQCRTRRSRPRADTAESGERKLRGAARGAIASAWPIRRQSSAPRSNVGSLRLFGARVSKRRKREGEAASHSGSSMAPGTSPLHERSESSEAQQALPTNYDAVSLASRSSLGASKITQGKRTFFLRASGKTFLPVLRPSSTSVTPVHQWIQTTIPTGSAWPISTPILPRFSPANWLCLADPDWIRLADRTRISSADP